MVNFLACADVGVITLMYACKACSKGRIGMEGLGAIQKVREAFYTILDSPLAFITFLH